MDTSLKAYKGFLDLYHWLKTYQFYSFTVLFTYPWGWLKLKGIRKLKWIIPNFFTFIWKIFVKTVIEMFKSKLQTFFFIKVIYVNFSTHPQNSRYIPEISPIRHKKPLFDQSTNQSINQSKKAYKPPIFPPPPAINAKGSE